MYQQFQETANVNPPPVTSILHHRNITLRTDQPEKYSQLEGWIEEQGHQSEYLKALDAITQYRTVTLFGLHQQRLKDFVTGKCSRLLINCLFEANKTTTVGGILLDVTGESLEVTTHT
jgi:predicted XRE-type DNA-binding protein